MTTSPLVLARVAGALYLFVTAWFVPALLPLVFMSFRLKRLPA